MKFDMIIVPFQTRACDLTW